MRKLALLLLVALLAPEVASAATSRNDDSCDISTMPAATLLLPYFEVDIRGAAGTARTTLLTIVNTSRVPQIAKVTLWTDWAYPVIDFPIYLTGYDVQAINLRDVLADGVIAATTNRAPVGERSLNANPNFAADAQTSCANVPTRLPSSVLSEVQLTFLGGLTRFCENTLVGGQHDNAVGYATIDVVNTCAFSVATDAQFFDQLLYDNVLTGDWQIVSPNPATGNFAAGNPLVHIRAIPEGGRGGERVATNLPFTFYDRFAGNSRRLMDRRQPLPSAFAARYIDAQQAAFRTDFLIWREGRTGSSADCTSYRQSNSRMPVPGMVRFDERENAVFRFIGGCVITCFPSTSELPAAARVSSRSEFASVPNFGLADAGGWIAFNLDNGGAFSYGVPAGRDFVTGTTTGFGRPSQNWVVPVMFAEGRYSVAFEATPLANGCSPAPFADPAGGSTNIPVIGPGANTTP